VRALFALLGTSRREVPTDQPLADVNEERISVVHFGDVLIREYDITASHHPGGTSGVPIEVGGITFDQSRHTSFVYVLIYLFLNHSLAGITTS
jgi:hypothetical protein